MAFRPDSIKTTPSVTYDLIPFVVKNTDSNQTHRDVTAQAPEGGMTLGSDVFVVSQVQTIRAVLGITIGRGDAMYGLNSREVRSAAANTRPAQ